MNRIKFNHEQIASVSAIAFFAVLAMIMNCLVWEVAEYLLTTKYQLNKLSTFTMQIRTSLDNINR